MNNHKVNELTEQGSGRKVLLVGGCGYIGSYLYLHLNRLGFRVTVVDLIKRGNPLGIQVIQDDYVNLSNSLIRQFDVVLWFGGHSSVAQSIADPDGALANNCLNLFSFAKRLPEHTKFIYASSGSLYSTTSRCVVPADENSMTGVPSQNAYDISKFAFDYLAKNFLRNFYALRMGTLSGYSPNLRSELVFNAMNISAATTSQVRLKNSESYRTILHLSDLWAFVYKLIVTQQVPGVYNVGSMSFKMGDLAESIAGVWGANIVDEGNSETYSFLLNITRMEEICGNDFLSIDLSQRCQDFISEYKKMKGM